MTASPRRSPWVSWRLAARLARRETLRRPWRTLLAALLVALPVAGMALAAVWARTDGQGDLERWRAEWGAADLYATPGAASGVDVSGDAELAQRELDRLLPADATTITYRTEWGRVLRATGGRRAVVEVTDLPIAQPLAAPVIQITSGRAPRAAGEVFLTRSVAGDLDVEVGDALSLERPEPARWRVVGVGERRAWWGAETVVIGPGTAFAWREGQWLDPTTRTVLVDLPAATTAAQLEALGRFAGGVAFAPGVAPPGVPGAYLGDAGGEGSTRVQWSWVVGALVLAVVGIVIAAAYAASARRQLVTLGQLAANGAAPGVLRRVLFLQGTWTGLAGTALGGLLAAAALAALAPHADRLLGRDVDPYTVRPADLAPIALLGVTAATLAALVPARTTARVPVLAALAGRRPLRTVPRWLTATGLGVGGGGLVLLALAVLGANGAAGGNGTSSSSGGTVWALTAIAGGVAVLAGACTVAPGYVSVLEPLARRLRGAPRLAARSLARQRTRTGAVVSAVCATSALAVAASALLLAVDAKDRDEPQWMRDDEIHLQATAQDRAPALNRVAVPTPVPDDLVADLVAAVPGSEAHPVAVVGLPDAPYARWELREFVPEDPVDREVFVSISSGQFPQLATVADDTFLDLYRLPARGRRALDRNGAVVLSTEPHSGRGSAVLVTEQPEATIEAAPPVESQPAAGAPIPVEVVGRVEIGLGSLPRLILTPERAAALGLSPQAGLVVVRAPGPLTGDQRAAVQDIVEEHRDTALDTLDAGGDRFVNVQSETMYPPSGPDPRLLEAGLSAAALLLSLFVVAVSLALAAAETRDERDVLAVVGAPPATMRRANGHKALLLTALGAALAVPTGFLPVAVFTAAHNADLPLVFPWRIVLLLIAAVPATAATVTTIASGLALRLRPVRISTMAFD